jgi:hypothetical protein
MPFDPDEFEALIASATNSRISRSCLVIFMILVLKSSVGKPSAGDQTAMLMLSTFLRKRSMAEASLLRESSREATESSLQARFESIEAAACSSVRRGKRNSVPEYVFLQSTP